MTEEFSVDQMYMAMALREAERAAGWLLARWQQWLHAEPA
jgi:hypothetical protein